MFTKPFEMHIRVALGITVSGCGARFTNILLLCQYVWTRFTPSLSSLSFTHDHNPPQPYLDYTDESRPLYMILCALSSLFLFARFSNSVLALQNVTVPYNDSSIVYLPNSTVAVWNPSNSELDYSKSHVVTDLHGASASFTFTGEHLGIKYFTVA